MESTRKPALRRPRASGHREKKFAASQSHQLAREEIALRAYALFVQSGRPAGRDKEFWLEAERQLESAVET